MNETKKPAIRFKGFSDEWEKHSVRELTTELNEYATLASPYPLLTSSREGLMFQNEYRSNRTTENDNTLFSVVPYGKCTYRHMSDDDIFHFNINYIVEKGLVSKEYPVFDSVDGNDLRFIVTLLNSSPQFRKFCRERKLGGTRTRLYYNSLSSFNTYCPTPNEQKNIANFLDIIDKIISDQTLELKKFKELKNSMLEKLFPKDGADVPEIRFKGFTGSWEWHKLSEIVEKVVRKNSNNESSLPLTISAQYGLVDQSTYFNNRVASQNISNYYLILNGEFAYNKSTSDSFPFGTVKRLDNYEKGVLSTLYIVFSIKNPRETNSNYLTVFFDTNRWHKGVAERASEGARNHGLLNISADDFLDIDLLIPQTEAEQAAIGSYFLKLNHLINLHQKELEKLQSIKKALLEKMFV